MGIQMYESISPAATDVVTNEIQNLAKKVEAWLMYG